MSARPFGLRNHVVALVAAVLVATLGATAHADAVKCKAAIIKATAGFVQAKTKALAKCEEAILKGKLPLVTDCHTEAKTAPVIAKTTTKLNDTVVKACAGKDKHCGTGDDDTLASIGWAIANCPNFENGTCVNPIADCSGIGPCLACIGENAVDQAIALDYGTSVPTDPKTQKALNGCQVTIGKAAAAFLTAKSKALAKCWGAVNKAGVGTCPDPAAAAAIGAASSKKDAAIKKACQGPDKTFGTMDDFTPAQIGFPSNCLDVGLPTCGGAVGTLQQLIDCVDCVTEFKVDCTADAAVPAFVSPYPAQCNLGTPVATPTPSVTPTSTAPTPTPSLTPSAGAATATPTPTLTAAPGATATITATAAATATKTPTPTTTATPTRTATPTVPGPTPTPGPCPTLGAPCGSCGNGVCLPHCGVSGTPLVCLDISAGSGSCSSDADCSGGKECTSTNASCAITACLPPCN